MLQPRPRQAQVQHAQATLPVWLHMKAKYFCCVLCSTCPCWVQLIAAMALSALHFSPARFLKVLGATATAQVSTCLRRPSSLPVLLPLLIPEFGRAAPNMNDCLHKHACMPLALHLLKPVMVCTPATSEQCAGVNGAAFLTQLTALQLTAIQSMCVFRVKCVGSHLALASHVLL